MWKHTKKHITDELGCNKRAGSATERRMPAFVIPTLPRRGNKSRLPAAAAGCLSQRPMAGMLHLIVDSFELAVTYMPTNKDRIQKWLICIMQYYFKRM